VEDQRRRAVEREIREWIAEADGDRDDGRYDDAIRLYEKALKVDPNNHELKKKIQLTKSAKAAEESLH
jgi:tetratricopeptide (TPR) repeat protein